MKVEEFIRDKRFQEIIDLISKNHDIESANKLKEKLPFLDFIDLDDSITFILWGEGLDNELCAEQVISDLKKEGIIISEKSFMEEETYRFNFSEKSDKVGYWVDDITINSLNHGIRKG